MLFRDDNVVNLIKEKKIKNVIDIGGDKGGLAKKLLIDGIKTLVYELTTNKEKKFAAQLLMDREVKRAVRKFGRKKVKASFSDNFVQLNLDLYNMPLDLGGAIEA